MEKQENIKKRFRVELQLKGTTFMEFRKLDDATYKKLKMRKIKTAEDVQPISFELHGEDFAMTYGISDNAIPEDFKLTVYDVTGLNEDESASPKGEEVYQTEDVDLIFNKFVKISSNTKPQEEIEDGPCFMARKYLLIEQYCDMMLFQFHIEDTKFDINQLEFQRMDNFNGLLYSNWSDPWHITYRGHYVRDVEEGENWEYNLDDPRYKIIVKGEQDYGWEIEKEFENKAILFTAMYSGDYLKTKLGHEAINIFAADNGKHYVYINPVGKISQDYDIECVLLGKLVKDGKFKVIAKATGLERLKSTKAITKQMSIRKKDDKHNYIPLPDDLQKQHLAELKGATYGGVPINELFDEELQVLATFEAKEVVLATEETYVYAYNFENAPENKLPEAKHDGVKSFRFAKQNPYMYFPEKNCKGEALNDYKKLQEIISKTKWKKESVGKVDTKLLDQIPPMTMVEIMGKEYDELAYSNMISYWLNHIPEALTKFVNLLKKKDTSILEPAGKIHIEREVDNIDLLISYGNTRIIIENKIKADISKYKDGNQLVKYKTKKKDEGFNVHCFLLKPNYSDIDVKKYDKDYIVINYSELYDFFSNIDITNGLPSCEDNMKFNDFCNALMLHTNSYDDSDTINLMRRFSEVLSCKAKQ